MAVEGMGGWRGFALVFCLGLAVPAAAATSRAGSSQGWWVERYVPETPRHLWLRLAADGEVESLALTDDRVSEVRGGRLTEAALRALRAAAERAAVAPEARLEPGLIPEGEILRLGGRVGDRVVSRSWRPELPGNDAARALAAEVERATAAVPRLSPPPAFVRTRPVEPDRVAMLKKDGRLPFRSRTDATRVASVARALAEPGRFVAVPPADEAALRTLAGESTQVFVEDGETFEVTVVPVTGR